ncbi:MAG: hypothetical protein COV72_01920, partial [Candidatus Omnitrophica bacterium CG11_big_fil_rev_8_21_14_0_20_42_13]
YFNKKTMLPGTSLGAPLILMPVLFSLSFINSVNLFNSFTELAGLIYLIILLLLVISVLSTPESLKRILSIYLLIGTAICVTGLLCFCLAYLKGDMINNPFLRYTAVESMAHHFPRIKLMFETPNMMLTYLHVVLVFGIALFMAEKKNNIKFLFGTCIVIIVITAFFTGSRRFTGFLLSFFLILSWMGKGKAASIFKYASFLAAISFFIISVVTSIWVVFPVKIARDDAKKNIMLEANYAYSLHYIQPVASVSMIRKHPIIGVGLGTYNANFRKNVDWEWLRSDFDFKAYPEYVKPVENRTLSFDPHSVFLGFFAETGILGLTGLLYFFGSYLVLLFRAFRSSTDGSLRKLVSGCVLAGFIGFLLNGITIDILSMRHFWFMMAAGIAALNISPHSKC